MRRTSGWVVAAVLAVAVAAAGQNPAPLQLVPPPVAPPVALPAANNTPKPATEARADPIIEQLIKDLGSDDYRTREKAGSKLAARGEKALPAMRAALAETDSAEVHRRLVVLVRKLEFERLVAPKRVTMARKDRTLKEAFAEISKQTGYKIDYNGNEGPRASEVKHTFEFEGMPFWQAMDQVAAAGGCTVFSDFNEDETIQVFNQDVSNPYVAYAGPFRFIANNINSNRNLQLAGINRRGAMQNRQEFINMNFQIQSEPKNPMLGITRVEVLTATDELGGSLAPPKDNNNRVNYFNNGMFRGHNTYGGLNLIRNERAANTLKTLKARVGVILLSGTIPEIVISDPLKVKTKTFTGRSVEVDFGGLTEDANKKGQYNLELTAKRLGGNMDQNPNEDFNWANCMWQKIELVDAAGNRYQSQGNNNNNFNGGSTIQLTIPFGPDERRAGQANTKLGPPAKVFINEWASVVNDVTIEFKNVPLP